MKIGKDQIIGALPKLGRDDLTAINRLTTVLLTDKPPDTPRASNDPRAWLYEAMRAVARTGKVSPKQFNEKAVPFLGFIEKYFGKLENRVWGNSIISMMVQLIAADLEQMGVPVTMTTLNSSLLRIHDIYDDAFPGYLQAGITHLSNHKSK